MNKQEAIEKIKRRTEYFKVEKEYNRGFRDGLNNSIPVIREIDAPERPVVPQYVADWIEWCKRNKVSLLGGFSAIDELGLAICNDKKVKSLDASKWATRNQETFAKAWFFGYEVEKEKLYRVELPNPNGESNRYGLCKVDGRIMIGSFVFGLNNAFNTKLTEAEIKQDFDWTWQFAKEWKNENQKEKLYTVEFPNPNSDNHLVLRKNINGKVCVSLLHSEYWRGNESTRLTEAEIKEGFEWAWQFAEEVGE